MEYGPGGMYSFPHTSYYDQDLGWLIKEYRRLAGEYDSIKEEVDRLTNLYDTIPDQIKEATDAQMEIIRAELDAYRKQLDEAFAGMRSDIKEMQETVLNITTLVSMLQLTISRLEVQLKAYADAQDEKLRQEIYEYINNIAKDWPPVVCPVDGRTESIQVCLNHMWKKTAWGISAQEIDVAGIKAEDFDRMQISAENLDRWGGYYIPKYFDESMFMFSPFTGQWMSIKQVIQQLADFHLDGVSASAVDDAQLPAEEVDAENVTARDADSTKDWIKIGGEVEPPVTMVTPIR